MPKREDEFWINDKEGLRYCEKHKRYYRADVGCQLCWLESSGADHKTKDAPALKKCPKCNQESIFWNPKDNLYECLNLSCKRKYNRFEFAIASGARLEKCIKCGKNSLLWNEGVSLYECTNSNCKRVFTKSELLNIPGIKLQIETAVDDDRIIIPPKSEIINGSKSKPKDKPPIRIKVKGTMAKLGAKILILAKNFLFSRWFLIIIGLTITFSSIAYYPSLLNSWRFGHLDLIRWLEIPIEVLGGFLALLGLFVGKYRTRIRTIRIFVILLVLFTGATYVWHYLDKSGKIDQWLHRSSSQETITGNIKELIPSITNTVRGLRLVSVEPTPMVTGTQSAITPTQKPRESTSRVWIGNAYVAGGDGHPITLVNNTNAKNPSWEQLVRFLEQDLTDRKEYKDNSFVCADFAEMLHNNAEKAGWRTGYVCIELGPSSYRPTAEGHALNVFETIDRGLAYIDCVKPIAGYSGNADKIVDVIIGKEYLPKSISPTSGWSSVWESMGLVKQIEVTQW